MAGALLTVRDKNYKKGLVMNGLSMARNGLGCVRLLSVCKRLPVISPRVAAGLEVRP